MGRRLSCPDLCKTYRENEKQGTPLPITTNTFSKQEIYPEECLLDIVNIGSPVRMKKLLREIGMQVQKGLQGYQPIFNSCRVIGYRGIHKPD